MSLASNPVDEAAAKLHSTHIVQIEEESEEKPKPRRLIEEVEEEKEAAAAAASAPQPNDLAAPFHILPHSFAHTSNAAVRALYRKWNLDASCSALKLRYLPSAATASQLSDPAQCQAFVASMINSDAFRAQFEYWTADRKLDSMPSNVDVRSVTLKPLRTTVTDLHFFDRLWEDDSGEGPIVYGSAEAPIPPLQDPSSPDGADDGGAGGRSAGNLRKCFEDQVDGVPVTDELRRALLDRDADSYELFSHAERQELMFVLFQHLVVGGGLNQYEESVYPYLSVLKLLYRDLLSVRTNRNTNALEIANHVYRLEGLSVRRKDAAGEESFPLFGKKPNDKHHLCLVSIEPHKHHVTVYYFAHTEMW